MRQHTHLFHLLEAAKTMRAYVTHNMDENEDLLASLETTKSKAVVAQKLAKKRADMLRKAEERKKQFRLKLVGWLKRRSYGFR